MDTNRAAHASSLPQKWSHVSSLSSSLEPPTLHNQIGCRLYQSASDESALAYRTIALRHLKGNPKSLLLSRRNRQVAAAASRSSTLATQPVLVRTYSGDGEDADKSKTLSRRLFFRSNFSGVEKSDPRLPSEEEFSIGSILRAIEPNVRETLDSIAEICGRSKLSLANEYGSHIAPLGEIRAPPGGLDTVEEASPSFERQTEESVVIFDDENSLADGHDAYSYAYLETAREAAAAAHTVGFQRMMSFPVTDGSSLHAHPEVSKSAIPSLPGLSHEMKLHSIPVTRDFPSKPKSGGRALLGRRIHSSTQDDVHNMVTPAIVSEVHLEAKAAVSPALPLRFHSLQTHPFTSLEPATFAPDSTATEAIVPRPQPDASLFDRQRFLAWFRRITQNTMSTSTVSHESAATRLRAMLDQDEN